MPQPVPNPVQEVSIEDEQSEKCNISGQVMQEDTRNQDTRSSVQSLINMMSLDAKKSSPKAKELKEMKDLNVSYMGDNDEEEREDQKDQN